MTVKELIERLQAAPPDAEVLLAEEHYTGGDYSQSLEEPVIYADDQKAVICVRYLEWYAKREMSGAWRCLKP